MRTGDLKSLRKAYHRAAARLHPDKVHGLPLNAQALAEELSGEVTFFEVNLQRARPLFTAESIRVAPSVQIYCGDVGRVSGNGLSGARMASGLRAAIKRDDTSELATLLATSTPVSYDALGLASSLGSSGCVD